MVKKEEKPANKTSAGPPKHCGGKYIEAKGKTTQEAIQSALKQLGTTRDKVVIKILCEGESGLYGMSGGKPSKVRATLK